jgi:hypothetical protein
MKKKLMVLCALFIILVSVLVSYGYYQETSTNSTGQTGSSGTVTTATLNGEINTSLLDENQGVEIGDMV